MAEKNMTQVQALEIAVTEMANEEAKAILAGMIEKRKAPRKPRANKEAIAFREVLVDVLHGAEGPLKAKEIAEIVNDKPQRVANNLRVLVQNGLVEKIPGEKAKDAATYVIA